MNSAIFWRGVHMIFDFQKIVGVIVLFGLFAVQASVQPGETPDGSNHYEKALQYFHGGELQSARIEVLNALKDNQEHIGARLLYAEIDLAAGNGSAAEGSVRMAQRFGANDRNSLVLLGKTLLLQRNFDTFYEQVVPGMRDRALEAQIHALYGSAMIEQGRLHDADIQFSIADKLWPQAPEAATGIAAIHLLRGEFEEAEKQLNATATNNPEYPQTWYLLGSFAQAEGEKEAALEYFSIAIERNVYYSEARNARIGLLLDAGSDDAAAEDIKFQLGISPFDPQSNYYHALLLAREGDFDTAGLAMRRVRKALGKMGNEYVFGHLPSLFLYGLTKFEDREYQEAELALNRHVQRAPENVGSRKLLGMLLMRENRFEETIQIVGPAVRISPDDPQLKALLASAYLKLRNTARAAALLEQAVNLAPFDRKIRTQLALTRLAVGQRTSAINELEEILSLDSSSGQIAIMLGFIYLQQGDGESALKWGNRVKQYDAKSVAAENLIGSAYLQMGQREEARQAFDRAIGHDASSVSARYNLAEMASMEGDFAEAEKQFELVIKVNPREVRAMVEIAQLALSRGDTQMAIKWYERLRQAEPNAVMNQLQLLEIYLANGRIGEAAWLANHLAARFPGNQRVMLALGRTMLASKDRKSAAFVFEQMSLAADKNSVQLQKIAELQLKALDVEGARRSLKSALNSTPDYLPALISMATLAQKEGETEDALELAAGIRAIHPQEPEGYSIAGQILTREGRFSEAVKVYREGTQMNSTQGSLHQGLLLARLQLAGDDIEAQDAALLEYLIDWINDNPEDMVAMRAYAGSYIQLGRYHEAYPFYESMLIHNPDDPGIYNAIAYIYMKLGDDRAYEYARQAYALAPGAPDVLDTYGWILYQRGEKEAALGYLRDARLLAPYSSEIHYHLAKVLFDLNRHREAQLELEAALARMVKFEGMEDAQALLSKLTTEE